jgi:hypothetical protein
MAEEREKTQDAVPVAPVPPVIGIFSDLSSATQASEKLRAAGFAGEDIALIEADLMPSAANAAGSYRATGDQDERATLDEPVTSGKEPQTEQHGLLRRSALTVQADAGQRQLAEEIIRSCGGTLQSRVAPQGLTDQGAEMPEGNPRAA